MTCAYKPSKQPSQSSLPASTARKTLESLDCVVSLPQLLCTTAIELRLELPKYFVFLAFAHYLDSRERPQLMQRSVCGSTAPVQAIQQAEYWQQQNQFQEPFGVSYFVASEIQFVQQALLTKEKFLLSSLGCCAGIKKLNNS